MKVSALALAFAFAVSPVGASAQADPGAGPSSDMRAKMEQARSDAKTASYNALSADHRTKVQAIVDKFDAGTLTDPRAAAVQIDAVLTPDETTAVLAQRQTMRDAMGASTRPGGAAPDGAGPPAAGGPPAPGGPAGMGGPPGGGGPASRGRDGGEHGQWGRPDAGRFLLTVAADREKLRAAMRAERERAPQ